MKTIEEALELAEKSNERRESGINYQKHKDGADFWLEYAKILAISQKNGVDRDNDLR